MSKSTLSISLAAFVCLLLGASQPASAQQDSTRLRAGTLQLSRNFTQHITIKGADLEKMPFTDLSDAINAWLYGAYTTSANLRYVVDGVPLGDVNGYSVFDIEEVTLVQDATAQSNGALQNQELVLVTTKRQRGTGMTVAAGGGFVTRNASEGQSGPSFPSATNGFQHYYIGLHHEMGNIRFGVSGDFTKDPMPAIRADSIHTGTPLAQQRGQLHGWLAADLDHHNQLAVQVDYAPQQFDSAQEQDTKDFGVLYQHAQALHNHEHVINPSVTWSSQFAKGWSNELRFGYLDWKDYEGSLSQLIDTSTFDRSFTQVGANANSSEHFHANERLAYTFGAGGWSFTPSVDYYYEHYRQSTTEEVVVTGAAAGPGGSFSTYFEKVWGHYEQLTPALQIAYKQTFDAQGGLVADLARSYYTTTIGKRANRVFPFVTMATDLLRWGQGSPAMSVHPAASLKLFFSYAASPSLPVTDYGLSTLTHPATHSSNLLPPSYFFGNIPYGGGGPILIPGIFAAMTDHYWRWDAGATFSNADGRLTLNYHFERQKFETNVDVPIPYGTGVSYAQQPAVFHSSLHYLGVRAKLIDGARIGWQTGIGVTTLRVTAPLNNYTVVPIALIGDVNTSKPSWTGGWTNRFSAGRWSLGADLLVHLNESPNMYAGLFLPPPSHSNSLLTENVYLGYRMILPKDRALDVYIDSRGLFRSGHPDPADGRRYLGAGAKLNI